MIAEVMYICYDACIGPAYTFFVCCKFCMSSFVFANQLHARFHQALERSIVASFPGSTCVLVGFA